MLRHLSQLSQATVELEPTWFGGAHSGCFMSFIDCIATLADSPSVPPSWRLTCFSCRPTQHRNGKRDLMPEERQEPQHDQLACLQHLCTNITLHPIIPTHTSQPGSASLPTPNPLPNARCPLSISTPNNIHSPLPIPHTPRPKPSKHTTRCPLWQLAFRYQCRQCRQTIAHHSALHPRPRLHSTQPLHPPARPPTNPASPPPTHSPNPPI